ncbi:polyprenyl synthetase family protein [Bordetella hinzii]|jgi:farnesyl diphosphate synthase|uniref:Polyprenyl synthetase family protein n=1 Tax=Bordetella hinzii TaxID=103855 RepID=A0AAN1RY44_9BORD|nr:farnesyl diphosphate synthase [Bordetella hinzii]AKQ56241.1 Farnesyl diphosphate synthase [Bordetella hinzii]AKQ60772.1 Farnesyl diphosphate synthase [Bordetella hinzii]AZW18204.1 polyprenyl synthetase family protein [Bordetella hinzii]KCB27416.1 polyprenyl synthetase [Bordetella hinzii CA90 BAL1384]KCB33788.1 polyprenyl synthetase [Bordetella hinzii L60]
MKQPHLACADWLRERADHIEQVLEELMPAADAAPARLHEAMRYAVLGGGKRVRAALVYAAGQACPVNGSVLAIEASMDRAAAAVELIHAYSLVHDDLPCMDDDTLRRGRPTTHVQFDEATAMLAGDALQPLAFELLAGMPIAPALVVQATQVLARAAGSLGMAGGQAIDLHSVGKTLSRDELQTMHSMKTGAMLAASVTLGGIVAGASSSARQALDSYAQAMGLAFQVVDDILDVTADSARLGKTPGKDAVENKPTYVSLLGLDQARELAEELRRAAHLALGPLGDSGARLAQLADFIVLRDR